MQIEYTNEQKALQPKLADANINPESFLATDYLNHFNEIVMLLEMIPDMPELVEDASDWQPKSYNQHFEDSGFQAKHLAIDAFNIAPESIRSAFNALCTDLNELISTTLLGLLQLNVVERGLSQAARGLVKQRVGQIQGMLLKLNQVIHGKIDEKPVIEKIVNNEKSSATENLQTQEDIDKLFD
ncbi:hypothetical protein [Kordiimonas pumila]|uniref:Chemotaxis protein CheZ n=1 Tax=Kordiimonas pumila TaxID=2161677 RepID=A0ABV7D1W3_9PROT|nr:hypothetical protein [Kordiimonas pumila]